MALVVQIAPHEPLFIIGVHQPRGLLASQFEAILPRPPPLCQGQGLCDRIVPIYHDLYDVQLWKLIATYLISQVGGIIDEH